MHSLYFRLARQNIVRHRRQYGPYLFTGVITAAVYFILASLTMNTALGPVAGSMMGFGMAVMMIFSLIFLFYTNSFLMKQRTRELGLYNVLGMSKRQIARVVFWETVLAALVVLPGGLLVGLALDKLMYLMVAQLIGSDIAFGFELPAAAILETIVVFGGILFLVLISNLIRVARSKPVALLQSAKAGEREPKTKAVMAILGALLLGGGYWLSFYSSQSPGLAIALFFVAVVLVILGTYMLFAAGSIAVLKLMRRNKGYYYKTRHFISVSGMLYRMKQNAVGLANICILSTMVLVIISSTFSLWVGQKERVETSYPADILMSVTTEGATPELDAFLQSELDANAPGGGSFERYSYLYGVAYYRPGKDIVLDKDSDSFFTSSPNMEAALAVAVLSEEEYAHITGVQLELSEGEAIAFLNNGGFSGETISVFGKDYRAAEPPENFTAFRIRGNVASTMLPAAAIIIPDFKETLRRMEPYFGEEPISAETTYCIDIGGTDAEQSAYYNEHFYSFLVDWRHEEGCIGSYSYLCRADGEQSMRELYGGFLFMGILLGIVFTMAAVLIIYYKQISEGTDDRGRFIIMQQVGLSKSEIKRAVHTQILTVFFLPLVTAGIHVVFAFPIIRTILMALLLTSTSLFVICSLVSFGLFAALYAATYALTARTYYKLVQ